VAQLSIPAVIGHGRPDERDDPCRRPTFDPLLELDAPPANALGLPLRAGCWRILAEIANDEDGHARWC
jgi:enoyl-CoA hydratase